MHNMIFSAIYQMGLLDYFDIIEYIITIKNYLIYDVYHVFFLDI